MCQLKKPKEEGSSKSSRAVDATQVDAMLDEVKSEDVPVEEAKEEELKKFRR